MFNWFQSDPVDKLRKQHARKLEEARDAQRNGKIPLYAELMAESEEIADKIEAMQQRS